MAQNVSDDEFFDSTHREELLKEVQSFNVGTLAEAALRAHHEKRSEAEEQGKRHVEEQRKASADFASKFEGNQRNNHINLTLSQILDEPVFVGILGKAEWKMDPENLAKAEFNASMGVQGIKSGDLRSASLFTEVVEGALWLEVAPWGNGSVKPPQSHPREIKYAFFITTDIHDKSAAVPLESADQLGAAVAREISKRLYS